MGSGVGKGEAAGKREGCELLVGYWGEVTREGSGGDQNTSGLVE